MRQPSLGVKLWGVSAASARMATSITVALSPRMTGRDIGTIRQDLDLSIQISIEIYMFEKFRKNRKIHVNNFLSFLNAIRNVSIIHKSL